MIYYHTILFFNYAGKVYKEYVFCSKLWRKLCKTSETKFKLLSQKILTCFRSIWKSLLTISLSILHLWYTLIFFLLFPFWIFKFIIILYMITNYRKFFSISTILCLIQYILLEQYCNNYYYLISKFHVCVFS